MRIVLVATIGLLLISCMASPVFSIDDHDVAIPFRVVGYLPDYRFAQFDAQAARRLTDLVVFSAEPSEDGGLDVRRLEKCPWKGLRTFKTQHRIRLILGIGGWERSSHFPEICNSESKRQKFVQAIVKFCLNERLDGVDIDWEHPKTAAEEEAYGKLLSDLRAAFDPLGLQLSMTIAAWQKPLPAAISAVDSVQIMAYDHDDQHSTFEGCQKDVQTVLAAGVPSKKIVLGLPFYGRDVKTRDAMTYVEIVAKHRPAPEADQVGNMYFNGPATIRRKTEFAMQSNLGGVMVWELGQDASGDQSLLKVVNEVTDRSTEAGKN